MRQVLLFIVALFGAPWVVSRILGVLLPTGSGDLSSFLIRFVPAVWTPTVLALLFVGVVEGPVGVRKELSARLRYRHGSSRFFVLAAVVPIAAVGVAMLSAHAAGDGAPFTPSAGIFPMIGVQIVTGAVGEELGWRGFLVSRLEQRVDVRA